MSFRKTVRALRTRASSSTLTDTTVDDRATPLLCHIARQEWDAVRDILSDTDAEETKSLVASLHYSSGEYSSNNALHYTCRYHPPWDVIKLLDKTNPDLITQIDSMGRTALHIAAENGASAHVIRYLISKHPNAAKSPDITGKTPLHMACQFYCKKYTATKNEDSPTLKESMRDAVRALCRVAPASVNCEDLDGMSALEYAIESGADLKVVRDIQKASEKDWKKRKASGMAHKHLEQHLKEAFSAQKESLRLEIMKLSDLPKSLSGKSDGLGKDLNVPSQRPVMMLSSRRTKPSGDKPALCA